MSKHSPLPWRAVLSDSIADHDEDATWIECDDHSIAELICPADEEKANADLIVTAVNQHAELLSAAELAYRYILDREGKTGIGPTEVLDKLQAVLRASAPRRKD